MADSPIFQTTTNKQQFDIVPPPPLETAEKERQRLFEQGSSVHQFGDLPEVTEDAVRAALRNEAKRHKYWKASAVTKMTINRIDNTACLHYAMESFTEMRSTSKAVEGVTLGQFLQQQQSTSGTANIGLNPWDYAIDPPEDFVEQVKVLEMPGTSELMACHSCNAEGLTHCFYCRGYGTDKCTCCRGTGMKAGVAHPAIYTHPMVAAFPHSDLSRGYPSSGTAVVRPPSGGLAYGVGTPVHFMTRAGVPPPGIGQHDLCHFCQGRGIRECSRCKGHGKKPCSACGGSGSIRIYIKLRVQFAAEHSDYYSPCDIPEKMLSKVSGQVIMSECQPYVLPLKKYPVQQINEISRQMCAAHLQKCIGRCRIIKEYRFTNGMFNVLLIAYLLLYFTEVIEGGDISGQENATSSKSSWPSHTIMTTNMYCEYPKDAFQVLINKQCPATHPFCVIDLPFDILLNQRYRCSTAPRRADLMVHLMNSSQLLVQINNDSELYSGHSNCMLTAFYSPDCAFSMRMVSYLYQLPRMYPRLRIVATDARDHSKLNSRYGIIGTPTILLWVDGSVVSRMDEAPFSLKAFRNYIEKWTDLELEYMPGVENESGLVENIEFHKSSFDWYLCVSWCSFVLSIAYFFMNSKYGKAFWETIRINYIHVNQAQR